MPRANDVAAVSSTSDYRRLEAMTHTRTQRGEARRFLAQRFFNRNSGLFSGRKRARLVSGGGLRIGGAESIFTDGRESRERKIAILLRNSETMEKNTCS